MSYAGATTGPVPKEEILESAAYEKVVRQLPCDRCGIIGFSQFCHSDEGKGMGLKTDVRRGWPGCGPRPGEPGCHYYVGTSGSMPREDKREFEAEASARTRAKVREMGMWPLRLPAWPTD